MFKLLTLITLIFIGNIFAAATNVINLDSLSEQLEKTERWTIRAAAFEMMASLASMSDADRKQLNVSLIDQFTEMEQEFGRCHQLELKSIETQEEAAEAQKYYKKVKKNLSSLKAQLENKIDSLNIEKR